MSFLLFSFFFLIFFLRPNMHDDAGSNFNGKNSNGSNRNLDEIRLTMIGNYYTFSTIFQFSLDRRVQTDI